MINKYTVKYNICFWTNIPSHYQRDFFKEIINTKCVNLQVRYFSTVPIERLKQKWEIPNFEDYEKNVDNAISIKQINNYKNYIHIITGIGYRFNRELLKIIIDENLKFIHWSEPYGVGIYKIVNFHPILSKILLFLTNIRFKRYAKILNEKSIVVLGQGIMSRNNFISWGVNKDKIEDLYYCGNIPSIEEFHYNCFPKYKVKHIFINIGELTYRKGIDLLLESFIKLENADDWGVLLIGVDSFKGYLQNFIKKHKNFINRICILPPISPRDIGKYINLGDVFILPSRYDGWGIVLNEAAAVGKPLIGSTMAGSSWHVIQENINGLRFKSGNINELTKAMQFFVNNPDKINIMGAKSKIIFEEQFSASQNAKRLIKILNKYNL